MGAGLPPLPELPALPALPELPALPGLPRDPRARAHVPPVYLPADRARDEWNSQYGTPPERDSARARLEAFRQMMTPPPKAEDALMPFENVMVMPAGPGEEAFRLIRLASPHAVQVHFRPRAIFIPARTAEDFDLIGGVRVGHRHYGVANVSARIPASIFGWACGHDECMGIERDADGKLTDADPIRAEKMMLACLKSNTDPRARVLKDMAFDTIQPGMEVTLYVANITPHPRLFRAVLVGTELRT